MTATPLSREVLRAARRFADSQSARLAAGPEVRTIATVAAVTPAGAPDGVSPLITVTWRGATVTPLGWNRSQTFAPGDRVVCDVIGDQLFIDYPLIVQL